MKKKAQPKQKEKTQVFAYKHFIGIKSDYNVEGLLNKPEQAGQMGFVQRASSIEISQEALDLLKMVPKSGDDIGDVDVFDSVEGVIFGWLGGPLKIIDTKNKEYSASNQYDPSLLAGVVTIVPNRPDPEFIEACDRDRV